MSDFFSFLQATRPKVGLVDSLNLSEIYPEDQDRALRNLFLPPESLDQIRGLAAEGLGKEDIRLIAGLKQRVIDSIALFQVSTDLINDDLFNKIKSNGSVGDSSKSNMLADEYSDNIIILHGGIAANSIEYKFKDKEGNLRTATVSTSRESLFNSERDSSTNQYISASYPGTLRVRRRGHYSDIKLAKNLFIPKEGITESPTNVVKVPVYMQTPKTSAPSLQVVEALASKNSPLRVPVVINNSGSFKIFSEGENSNKTPYYFGYEVRRAKDNYRITGEVFNDSSTASSDEMTRIIDTVGRPGNNQPAYLYIYCVPSLVDELRLEGLGIEENDLTPDLGLIGFDNLKIFSQENNRLSTIPTWLKVNHGTLKELDISNNQKGSRPIIGFFDYQTSPGLLGSASTPGIPSLSMTQILAYSGFPTSGNGAPTSDYDGTLSTAATAGGHLLHKTRLNPANNDKFIGALGLANGIRTFNELETLIIKQSATLVNPDFSVIFPALKKIDISANPTQSNGNLIGNPPKLKNNSAMTLDISHQDRANGNLRDMGGTVKYDTNDDDDDKKQFIGQFEFINWGSYGVKNLSGGICTDDSMLGDIGLPGGDTNACRVNNKQDTVGGVDLNRYSHVDNGTTAAEAWSGWLKYAQQIRLFKNDVALNLADSNTLVWENLKNLTYGSTSDFDESARSDQAKKIRYNPAVGPTGFVSTDTLNAPKLVYLYAFRSGWCGRLFSISKAPELQYLNIGNTEWSGYAENNASVAEPGKYILPTNFYSDSDNESKLETLRIDYNKTKEMKFRSNDFENLKSLRSLIIDSSYWTGSFPELPDSTFSIAVGAKANRFHDLSALSIQKNLNKLSSIQIRGSGSGVGGAIIPLMKPTNPGDIDTILTKFDATGSLPTNYPVGWSVANKGNKPAFNALYSFYSDSNRPGDLEQEEWVSGSTTFVSKAYKDQDLTTPAPTAGNILLKTAGVSNLQKYVRVGDLVIIDGVEEGRVGSIFSRDSSYEYIVVAGANITLNYSSNTSVTFRRKAIDAEGFFDGCRNIKIVNLKDCSLGGKIPKFKNTGLGKLVYLDLNSNLFTSYQSGTLQNITGSENDNFTKVAQLARINLENNPLDRSSIRNIIQDAHNVYESMGNSRIKRRIKIRLKATKPDISAGTYSNWKEDEIFDSPSSGEDPLKTKFKQLGSSKIDILLFDTDVT